MRLNYNVDLKKEYWDLSFINANSLTSLNHSQLPTYFEKATQTDSYLSSLPYRVTENSKKLMQQTLVIELKQCSFYQIKCYFAFRRRTEEACKNRYYLLPQFGLLNFEDNHIEVFDSLESIHMTSSSLAVGSGKASKVLFTNAALLNSK